MPGLWVLLADNPDFYKSFDLDRGSYIESSLYDEAHQDQGKGLWRTIAVDENKKGRHVSDCKAALVHVTGIKSAAR